MPLFASHQLCFTGGRLLVGKYVIYLHEWLYIKSVRVNRTFAKCVEEVNHKYNDCQMSSWIDQNQIDWRIILISILFGMRYYIW